MRKIFIISAVCFFLCACSANSAEVPQPGSEIATAAGITAAASPEITETESETSAEAFTAETETESVTEISRTEAETEPEPADECHCEYEWQHDYAEYINQLWFYYGLYIDDINGDDIPEAVISVNPFEYTIILYYTENGLAELELPTESMGGEVDYIADTGQILHSRMRGHTTGTYGYEDCFIYDWTGTEYTETLSVLRESGYYYYTPEDEFCGELGQAYINGEEVDNDAFEAKMEEIRELAKGNGYFPVVYITDENFGSYAKEKLPDFKMPEFNYQ